MSSTPTPLDRKKAVALLWNKGVLHWKLTPVQRELYNTYLASTEKVSVWSCSRRLGKSYALCIIAVEKCLSTPGAVVKYIAPTQKHVKMIIRPLLKEILKDCPKELRPNFRTAENIYRFPNGSEIQMAGTDSGHAEALRGGSSHLGIVDEAGFCTDLRYVVQSVLLPTTTMTKGKIILSSTPPTSPDHEFVEYMEEAELKSNFIKKTIDDNPMLTPAEVAEIERNYSGGRNHPDFRREYLCEVIRSADAAVVPEFTPELEQEVVTDWPTPPFRDLYVGGDIGFRDLTVFLFGYYDFRNAKIVIEDELVMSGQRMTTEYMAEQLKAKEAALWTNKLTGEQQEPYLRVCDNNLIVINDLYKLHRLSFQPTAKDDADAALNNMKILLQAKRIIIHPRCKTLILHLKRAVWNKKRNSYARSPDMGHYDAVDALKYFVRAVQQQKNPYPANYGMGQGDNYWRGIKSAPTHDNLTPLAKTFIPRRSLRINKS